MKIGFGVVVYKESMQFCKDFTKSINSQDYSDFDILLLNDNLNCNELDIVLSSLEKNIVLLNKKLNYSIPQLRFQLISDAKKIGYDLLILGDFDDKFSLNRIRRIVSEYNENVSFYYNDIYYFDNEKYFNKLPNITDNLTMIIEHNYLGLSNTALNLNNIDFNFIDKLFFCTSSVFDWYLYSLLLSEGHVGKMVQNCSTFYRIYDNNIAGEKEKTLNSLKKEISVKINHYNQLKKYNFVFNELYEYYINVSLQFDDNKSSILESTNKRSIYWWGLLNSNNYRLE